MAANQLRALPRPLFRQGCWWFPVWLEALIPRPIKARFQPAVKPLLLLAVALIICIQRKIISLMETISQNGAVVSEFAFSMPPLKHNFPWRNRIISALGLATVVIEAGRKSGALITADYALSQNKDVFVVPSNIDTQTALGSNQLIQDGARVALNPDDVLSQIKEDFVPSLFNDNNPMFLLSEEQEKVYPHITNQPIHVDELVGLSGLSISCLLNITLSLELKHAIRQLPGQYYVRK